MLINLRAAACAALLGAAGAGAAGLGPGDIAIVAVDTDDDAFAWVALRDIPAGTAIHFTDSSVSNGLFRWSEHLGELLARGPLSWSSPAGLTAGTVVRWDSLFYEWSVGEPSGASPVLSSSGDQVIAYTGSVVSNAAFAAPWRGDPAGAVMLAAANIANSGWDNLTGGSTEASYVPPGLSTYAGTALHLGSADNACYAGPRRGTPAQIRAWLGDHALWRTSNSLMALTNWPAAFEVLAPPGKGTMVSVW